MRGRRFVVVAVATVVAVLTGSVLYAALAQGGTPLTATLTGEAEVGQPGDADGSGTAVLRLNESKRTVCFELTWSRIGAPFAAHIHRGSRTEAGPVVVGLFEQGSPIPGTIRGVQGCVRNVERATIRAIRNNPGNYYVNVHTEAFPAGAIRGQLA
jgi:hypothetical protein